MNHHKNARLTFARRLEMVRQMTQDSLTPADAAAAAGVSEPTARKWLGRFLAGGEPALADASRPARARGASAPVEGAGHRRAQATPADLQARDRGQPWA
jgi:transposase-like protein